MQAERGASFLSYRTRNTCAGLPTRSFPEPVSRNYGALVPGSGTSTPGGRSRECSKRTQPTLGVEVQVHVQVQVAEDAYASSAYASMGGHEHIRWRSPQTLSARLTGGQYLCSRVHGAG